MPMLWVFEEEITLTQSDFIAINVTSYQQLLAVVAIILGVLYTQSITRDVISVHDTLLGVYFVLLEKK